MTKSADEKEFEGEPVSPQASLAPPLSLLSILGRRYGALLLDLWPDKAGLHACQDDHYSCLALHVLVDASAPYDPHFVWHAAGDQLACPCDFLESDVVASR